MDDNHYIYFTDMEAVKMAYYMASVSWGKDSLAMLLRLINENKPLDEVVFFDTGMEFQAIYKVITKDSPKAYLNLRSVFFPRR